MFCGVCQFIFIRNSAWVDLHRYKHPIWCGSSSNMTAWIFSVIFMFIHISSYTWLVRSTFCLLEPWNKNFWLILKSLYKQIHSTTESFTAAKSPASLTYTRHSYIVCSIWYETMLRCCSWPHISRFDQIVSLKGSVIYTIRDTSTRDEPWHTRLTHAEQHIIKPDEDQQTNWPTNALQNITWNPIYRNSFRVSAILSVLQIRHFQRCNHIAAIYRVLMQCKIIRVRQCCSCTSRSNILWCSNKYWND